MCVCVALNVFWEQKYESGRKDMSVLSSIIWWCFSGGSPQWNICWGRREQSLSPLSSCPQHKVCRKYLPSVKVIKAPARMQVDLSAILFSEASECVLSGCPPCQFWGSTDVPAISVVQAGVEHVPSCCVSDCCIFFLHVSLPPPLFFQSIFKTTEGHTEDEVWADWEFMRI